MRAKRVSPIEEHAIAAILRRADQDTVSIKAALNHVRHAAPGLGASNDEIIDAIIEAAAALGLSVASDAGE